MNDNTILIMIEEAAEAIVFADPMDLQSLALVHTKLTELNSLVELQSSERVAEATMAAACLIEKIILGEISDLKIQSTLDTVSKTVAELQAIFRDGRSILDAQFPEELGLDSIHNHQNVEEVADNFPESKMINDDVIEVESNNYEMNKSDNLKGDSERVEFPLETTDESFLGNEEPVGIQEPYDKKVKSQRILLEKCDSELLGEFILESTEHLESADTHLLTLEAAPDNDESINAVFRAFHSIKGVAGFLFLDEIGGLAHEAENLLDKARQKRILLTGDSIDVIFESADLMKTLIAAIEQAMVSKKDLYTNEKVEVLVNRIKNISEGKFDNKKVTEADRQIQNFVLDESSEDSLECNISQFEPEESVSQTAQSAVALKETIKVDAYRLDRLVDLIGELVVSESMIRQSRELQQNKSANLNRQLVLQQKITRNLQELGTNLRMVPVKSTFGKMARLVRDLAKKSQKKITLTMAGEDTELDKTVVQKIGDPLVHMIRNSVDHGIESPQDRIQVKKSENGTIELHAFHKGGNVFIEIRDDGRGLDPQKILDRAIERGLVSAENNLSEIEILNLVFQPGFSTAEKVTEISGRGVGMDVVKRNIEQLRGQVEVKSTVGKGSVFSMRVPLTLAIIDGMIVQVGCERYIFPTLSITKTVRPDPNDISTVINRGEMYCLHDHHIPLFRLYKLFNIENARTELDEGLVIVIEDEGKQIAIMVDELLGQQQIVIKSLGEVLNGTCGIAGGAIMSDGQVGVILDINGLIKLARSR